MRELRIRFVALPALRIEAVANSNDRLSVEFIQIVGNRRSGLHGFGD